MALGVPETIGDYKILDEIGHGGMGTLYRARDPKIGRDIAIKLLREGIDDNDARERFAREARSAGRLKHGNIVTIFELGEHGGMPFIAMEYIQGQTLAQILKQKPLIPLARKLQMMDQVCAGLHYAHRMGVVHRDIKPANIMIDEEGTIKILDFGIARMGASKITQTGVVIGTLNYMAPEQMKGNPTDARADMFSIGAVFYELLSYRNAFAGDAPSTVMHRILYGRPEQLEVVCPTLDPALVAIITRCIEKQPEQRYPDLGAVRSALAAVSRRLQVAEEENDNEATLPVRLDRIDTSQRSNTPASGSSRRDAVSPDQMRVRAEQTRAKRLQTHLEAGRAALEQGDYDGTFAACEQALVLDPTNAEALELEGRARAKVDRQLQDRLNAARADIDRGALTSASLLADQVLAINPESAEANAIRRDVEAARQRLAREQELGRERKRAFDTAFGEAQRHLTGGALDSADQAIERALSIDASHPEALALKEKITQAVVAARRRAEEETRARKAVEDARRLFGTGDHAGAYALLDKFAAGHSIAASALAALKLEAREIERRRAEEEHKELEEQAARLKRETEAARQKLAAEVERLKREGEEARNKLESEKARLQQESETERVRIEAEAVRLQKEAEAERAAREAEAARLKAETDRVRREAEAAQQKRDAEAERLRRETEKAQQKRNVVQPVLRPQPVPRPPVPASGSGVSNAVLFGGIGLAVVILAVVIVWSLRPTSGAATTGPAANVPAPSGPPATPSPTVEPAIATTPSVPTTTPSAADQIKQLLAQAQQRLDRGELDAAIELTDQVLAREAGQAEAARIRAQAARLLASTAASAGGAARGGPPVDGGQKPGGPTASAGSSNPSGSPGGGISAPPEPPPAGDAGAARAKDLADRYERARNALESGGFANAIPLFEGLQRDEPNFRDVAALLARARERLSASAKQALDAGAKLEGSGDLPGALQQFQRARQIDPSVAATADPAINRIRGRMKEEGTTAFTRARQYYALDRVEQAIKEYERAFNLLPDDDPNKKEARARLDELRGRR